MLITYDSPIKVTEKQYYTMMNKFSGIVAGRKEGNEYFIKVWLIKYKTMIQMYLS